MKKTTYTLLAAAVVMTAAVAACSVGGHRGNGDDNFYSAFRTFTDSRWDYADTLHFTVDTLRDSISRGGRILVSVRHTHGYDYSNLWLELSTPFTDSTRRNDTINLRLADDFGRWLGGGMGTSLLITDTLRERYDLRQGSDITLRHIMRVDTLDAIEQVGIVFIPND